MLYSVAMPSIHTSPLDMPGRTRDAGGMNVYMRELARELGQHQVTVDIFTRWTNEHQPRIVQLSPQARVIHIKAGPLAPIDKHDLYEYLPIFAQRIDEFRRSEATQYDILHSHYWLSGVAAMQLAQRWDIPHVTMFHTLGRLKQLARPGEPEPALRLEMERRLIAHADRIIAATGEERVQMMREKAQIVIVGGKLTGDSELRSLRELAANLNIGQRVKFLGARPQKEMPMIYSAADVTVIPSYHESFGLAAVESLACGTPVVATSAGGLTTIVRDGKTGYLVPRCTGFFAGRLDTLLSNPDLLARMRSQARGSVLQFSWRSVANQVLDVYHELASEARYLAAL